MSRNGIQGSLDIYYSIWGLYKVGYTGPLVVSYQVSMRVPFDKTGVAWYVNLG